MLEERNFRSLDLPPVTATRAPRNNVSKATGEWRVVTSVQPSPLVWFMWPGSNKNGNQINPATLQVEGCLIELSKAWLRLRMIMLGNAEGSISAHPARTPYISLCSFSHSAVKCIQNNCTPTASPASSLWRLFVVWRTLPVSAWWIPCTQTRAASGAGLAGKLTDLWIT